MELWYFLQEKTIESISFSIESNLFHFELGCENQETIP